MTAQPFRWYNNTPLPGPWYCVTNLADAHPAFTLGVSPTGPIPDGQACARQPSGDSWTPPSAFFVPPIKIEIAFTGSRPEHVSCGGGPT